MKVKTVGEAVPSPDGKMAVWTQTRSVMDSEKSESLTQIWLMRPVSDRLTAVAKGSEPRFAPDRQVRIFHFPRRDGKPTYIALLSMAAKPSESVNSKSPASHTSSRRTAKWIAFTGREPDAEEERAKKEKRDFRVDRRVPE